MIDKSYTFTPDISFITFMKPTLCILIGLSLLACRHSGSIEIKNKEGQIVQRIKLFGDTTEGKNGIYERFDDMGKKLDSSIYIKGKLEGEKKIFQDGVLYSIEYHKNDLYEGPYKVYYPNGQIQLEAFYSNNEMTGTLKSYYPSGAIKEIVEMKSNQENGPFKEFYENGSKKAEGQYKNGPNEDGELMLYDSLGTLIRRMNCLEGICHTIWKIDSTNTNIQ